MSSGLISSSDSGVSIGSTRSMRGGANDLARFARICRVSRVMQPYLDSIA